uniref:Myotubularin phosphatase domain-containing protein n=1 Tax=Macrostomum lignano TaxID=282301 RepID=A0A1I8FD29_9PLAT
SGTSTDLLPHNVLKHSGIRVWHTEARYNFFHRLSTPFNGTCRIYWNPRLLKRALSSGVIASRYNIPFLLPYAGQGHRVTVGGLQCQLEQLKNLDHLECIHHVYERREMIVNLTQSSAAVDTSCLSYFLVRSLPKLLELLLILTALLTESMVDGT